MKVVFITCWYPSIENPSKGIFIKEHAKAISNQGVDLKIFNIDLGYSSSLLKIEKNEQFDNSFSVFNLKIRSIFWKIIYVFPSLLWKIVKNKLKNHEFDIVHSNVIHPAGYLGYKLSKFKNKPHVISEHWSNASFHLSRQFLGSWARKAMTNADRILPVSQFLGNQLKNWQKNIEIIPNVVDTALFYKKEINSLNKRKFIMVGSWNKGKTQIKLPELAVEALNNVSKNLNIDIELTIVGEGDLLDIIKSSNYKIKINYTGNLPKIQVADYLRSSDVLLHASKTETFSLVIAEALSCGLNVVASNVGGIPELVTKEYGVLVENNLNDWENGIQKVLEMTNCNFDSSRLSLNSVGKKLVNTYKEVLS